MTNFGKKVALALIVMCLGATTLQAGWNPFGKRHKRSGEENAQLLIKRVKDTGENYRNLFNNAVGWAVFPSIGKAGMGIGGAAGNGRVYHKGEFIGTTTVTQLSVGFQLGGQVYGEIIFFQDDSTLDKFKNGKFELGANVSAVVLKAGTAGTVGFKDGTIVLVIPKEGLMYEASISGQKFTFKGKK